MTDSQKQQPHTHSVTRRSLVKNSLLAGLTAALPFSSLIPAKAKKLKILILGGTGFLGPHTVNAALAQGHEVTLFNRGKSNPQLFSHLETIKGDRNTADIKRLAGRRWDAVIDTSAYFPRSVNLALEVLKKNIDHYLLISSISVYKDWSVAGMDENAPLASIKDSTTETINGETYGALKALCEQAAEKQMPGGVIQIRPGLIVGPRDKTDRFTYWPARVKKGGDFLAPGDGKDFIQYIDVRDLAEWMVLCLQKRLTGAFNAQTNGGDVTMGQLLKSCVETINPAARPVWVATDFLENHKVTPWQEMPVWIPATGEYAGAGQMSSQKAYANGLGQRELATVIQDCYNWFSGLPPERQVKLKAGISLEKESLVLKAWAENTLSAK